MGRGGLILLNGEGGGGILLNGEGGGCYCGIRAYLLNLDSCVIGSVYL